MPNIGDGNYYRAEFGSGYYSDPLAGERRGEAIVRCWRREGSGRCGIWCGDDG